MSFKLQRQLVQIPYSYLRLIGPCSDGMVSVSRGLDFVASFWELEMLDELDGTFDLLADGSFCALSGCSSFSREPIRKRGRRTGGRPIDCVDFDRTWVWEAGHFGEQVGSGRLGIAGSKGTGSECPAKN